MCYDFAHSYINSKKLGYDFLRSIRVAKPYIRHAHVNDNFGKGKPESAPPYIEAMPMGIGDLHLPIGWGNIPYEDVFRIMAGYVASISLSCKRGSSRTGTACSRRHFKT